MLCVQCCHIFFFFSKIKEKKRKNPGSISHFCLLKFSPCVRRQSLQTIWDGRQWRWRRWTMYILIDREFVTTGAGKHSEEGKGLDFGRVTGGFAT